LPPCVRRNDIAVCATGVVAWSCFAFGRACFFARLPGFSARSVWVRLSVSMNLEHPPPSRWAPRAWCATMGAQNGFPLGIVSVVSTFVALRASCWVRVLEARVDSACRASALSACDGASCRYHFGLAFLLAPPVWARRLVCVCWYRFRCAFVAERRCPFESGCSIRRRVCDLFLKRDGRVFRSCGQRRLIAHIVRSASLGAIRCVCCFVCVSMGASWV